MREAYLGVEWSNFCPGGCFAVLTTGSGGIFAKVFRISSDMLRGSSLPKFRPVKTLALEKTLENTEKNLDIPGWEWYFTRDFAMLFNELAWTCFSNQICGKEVIAQGLF